MKYLQYQFLITAYCKIWKCLIARELFHQTTFYTNNLKALDLYKVTWLASNMLKRDISIVFRLTINQILADKNHTAEYL